VISYKWRSAVEGGRGGGVCIVWGKACEETTWRVGCGEEMRGDGGGGVV